MKSSVWIDASGHTQNPAEGSSHTRNILVYPAAPVGRTFLAMSCANGSTGQGPAMGEEHLGSLRQALDSGVVTDADTAGDCMLDLAHRQAETRFTPDIFDDTAFDVLLAIVERDRADILWCGGIVALLLRGDSVREQTVPHFLGEADYLVRGDRQAVYADERARTSTRIFGRPRNDKLRYPPLERLGVRWRLEAGDKLVIMADNVWLRVWNESLPKLLTGGARAASLALVAAAQAAGASEDISAIVAEVRSSEDRPQSG